MSTKKILSLFTTKGKQTVNPFDLFEQYCRVKMALIIEGIFISKTVTSLQTSQTKGGITFSQRK